MPNTHYCDNLVTILLIIYETDEHVWLTLMYYSSIGILAVKLPPTCMKNTYTVDPCISEIDGTN